MLHMGSLIDFSEEDLQIDTSTHFTDGGSQGPEKSKFPKYTW